MERISSMNNPKVKQWSSLLKKKGRDETGLFLLEGLTSILEALHHGAAVETVIILDEDESFITETSSTIHAALENLPFKKPHFVAVPMQVLNKVTETHSPQGVVAVIKQPDHTVQDVQLHQKGMYVLLDGIQDPGNLGTIIRTADAAGAKAVIIGEGTVDLYNPKVVRSTMGSLFHLPIIKEKLEVIIPTLKENGMAVVGTRLSDSVAHFHYQYPEMVGVLVGNEAKGVSESVADYIDHWVKIPMVGAAESLNVAIATAVILYEALRQHH